jgi:WD40 repeat protein
MAVSPDGQTLATGAYDEMLLCRLTDRKTLVTLPHPKEYQGSHLTFSADGKRLAGASGCCVRIWQIDTARELMTFRRRVGQYPVVFSPDLRWLAAPNYQDVDLWSMDSGKPGRVLEDHRGWVKAVAFHPDGKTLAVLSGYSLLPFACRLTQKRPFPDTIGRSVLSRVCLLLP